MSLDSKLLLRSVAWANALSGFVDDSEKYLFAKDSIIELVYLIEPDSSGYTRISLADYKFRSILDMYATRYDDYRSAVESKTGTGDSYRLTEYALHGRMIVVKTDTSSFYFKLRFIGCPKTNLKEDVENEMKLFYLALVEQNAEDIYSSMSRLTNAYKNTIAENSQNTEVVKKSYSQIKLNGF